MIPINNLDLRKTLLFSTLVILINITFASLAANNINIPVFHQIAGFLFISFIPGILILRILRVHQISFIESLAYIVGLSLAFIMFFGAFINLIMPLMGIAKPITLLPVVITFSIFISILIFLAYIRDQKFTGVAIPSTIKPVNIPVLMLLVLILLTTILGVILNDAYQNNILLIICLIAIVVVVILATTGKFIKPDIYPFVIFVISLCLLYQTTLMSPYLVGTDIYAEYQVSNSVLQSGFWDISIPYTINSCLSITMLAPIYSLVLNIPSIWVFKAVYPLFFSLVPLILFYIFSRQFNFKLSFLAAFLFMAIPTFSLEMISLCRQQIAELFLVLFILLLVEKKLRLNVKLFLAVVFTISIAVSHYAIGFISMVYLALLVPLLVILSSRYLLRIWGWFARKFGGLPDSVRTINFPISLLVIVVLIYFMFSITWYGVTSSGINLNFLGGIWNSQIGTIVSGIANANNDTSGAQVPAILQFGQRDALIQTALGLDFAQASLQGKIFRILQFIIQLFLVIGCLRLICNPRNLRVTIGYISLSIINALLIAASIILPGFAERLNTTRLFQIALITLAPFCIFGGEALWKILKAVVNNISGNFRKNSRRLYQTESKAFYWSITLILLVPYFLLSSGIVYELTKQDITDRMDTPYSIALSSYRLDLAGIFYWGDGAAVKWLSQTRDPGKKIYADYHSSKILNFYGLNSESILSTKDLIENIATDNLSIGNLTPGIDDHGMPMVAWEAGGHKYAVARNYIQANPDKFYRYNIDGNWDTALPQCTNEICLMEYNELVKVRQWLEENGFPQETKAGIATTNNYIYLRSWNVEKGELILDPGAYHPGLRRHLLIADDDTLSIFIKKSSKIYDNGKAQTLSPVLPIKPSLAPLNK